MNHMKSQLECKLNGGNGGSKNCSMTKDENTTIKERNIIVVPRLKKVP